MATLAIFPLIGSIHRKQFQDLVVNDPVGGNDPLLDGIIGSAFEIRNFSAGFQQNDLAPGNIIGLNFELRDEKGEIIAVIGQKMFSIHDKYCIDIYKAEYEEIVVAILVTLQHMIKDRSASGGGGGSASASSGS